MKNCGTCKNFRALSTNKNFGKCMLGITPKDEYNNVMAQFLGANQTIIPIVHFEDTHSCFACGHPSDCTKGIWLTEDLEGYICANCGDEFLEPPNEMVVS